jgi:hypothetical protein
VTYSWVLDSIIWFIYTLYIQIVTTNITALSLIYTLYKSLGHAKSSQSSIVVSWQGIYNSLTVTAAHYEVFFAKPNSFLAIILPTANSGDSLNSLLQMPTPEINSVLILAAWDPRYIASGRSSQKTPVPLLLRVDSLLQNVFTAPLGSNERGADHRKHRSSIVARVPFRVNVFTELLTSN